MKKTAALQGQKKNHKDIKIPFPDNLAIKKPYYKMDSKFRTVYITDPRFERNNLRHITAKSKHLKGRADITVFVPEEAHELNQVPLLTLLHGVYGSHLDWPYKAGVHFIADRLIKENKLNPIMIAMPSDGLWGDGSGYITHKNGNDYEKWIVEDVPNAVSETVNFFDRNDSLRFISGLSMGGYGALRIGAKYPAIYKGISAHSSITTLKEMQSFIEDT